MISVCSSAALGQQLELGGPLGHDLAGRLVQPVEAGVESRITAGGIAGEREVAVEPRFDALGLTVQSEEEQLGGCLGQMEEREDVEAHARFVGGVDGAEERRLADWAFLANRGDNLHGVLETGRTGAA